MWPPRLTGVEPIYELELSEPNYSYDLLGVWRDETGFYLGTDSGCSCPMPWENHTKDDLTGPLTLEQAIEESVNLWRPNKYVPIEPLLHALVESYLNDVDASFPLVENQFDIPNRDNLTVVDAEGVEWTRPNDYNDFVLVDGDGVTRSEFDMKYPLTVKEEVKND